LVEKYHYSKNLPAGKNICFGWFLPEPEEETDLFGEKKTPYAVAVYGIGSNARIYDCLARESGLLVNANNTYELKRLVREGDKEDRRVSLSQLLSVCHKALLKEDGIRYIVSYSDPQFNPDGGIYAASNFTLIGWTNNHNWQIIKADGTSTNRRTLNHWRAAHGNPSVDDACAILGYKKVNAPPKKRWFLCLDPKDQKILRRKFPPKPKTDWITELEETVI